MYLVTTSAQCRFCFSKGLHISKDLIHLEEDLGEDGVKVDPLLTTCVRRAVRDKLYAYDAGIVSESAEGQGKITTVIVPVFEAAGLAVSETKTETMLLRTPNQAPQTSPLIIKAAGQIYRRTMQLLYLGGFVVTSADNIPEITRRIRLAWACYNRFKREL